MDKCVCPHCGAEVPVISNVSQSAYVCTCVMCGGHFSYEYYRSEDIVQNSQNPVQTNDKILRCNICNREFTQASGLKRHYAVHTGERPFPCDTCGKSFKTKAALKRHQIIHTGECPFECMTCKRRFNQISNLRKHLLIHNNKCPFNCTTCGKGFNQLSNLKKHQKVHERRPDLSTRKNKRTEGKDKRPVLTFVKPADDFLLEFKREMM